MGGGDFGQGSGEARGGLSAGEEGQARSGLDGMVGGRERGLGPVLTSTCWEDILVSAPAANRVCVVKSSIVTFLPLSWAQPAALHLCGESLHGAR